MTKGECPFRLRLNSGAALHPRRKRAECGAGATRWAGTLEALTRKSPAEAGPKCRGFTWCTDIAERLWGLPQRNNSERGEWFHKEKRAAGVVVPAARLSSSRVAWLAQPTCQIWHYFMNCFKLCFSRCPCPPTTRRPKFPPACALFTTLLKDRQQCLFEERICQVHVSLVAFNRHLQLSNWGLSMLETAIALIVGFALGYGVREWLSRRRRQAERQRREAFGT
jgi:hypothetical protein